MGKLNTTGTKLAISKCKYMDNMQFVPVATQWQYNHGCKTAAWDQRTEQGPEQISTAGSEKLSSWSGAHFLSSYISYTNV